MISLAMFAVCSVLYSLCRRSVADKNCSVEILRLEKCLAEHTESASEVFARGPRGDKVGLTACRWGMSHVDRAVN